MTRITPTPSPIHTAVPEQTPTVEAPQPAATLEPPALAPEVAPPTPPAGPAAPAEPSQPVRLIIPQIGLDQPPVAVGLDERRIPIVPRHDVGWFTGGAVPGLGSNVVFWGHVLRWKDAPEIAAPFARVHELQPGAEITVVTADGREHRYRVVEQVQVRPEDVHYIYPTTRERVTLVSCIGDNVILNGTLTKEFRLVTIAEPIAKS
jgi:sortase (surface protein transpeptidase)